MKVKHRIHTPKILYLNINFYNLKTVIDFKLFAYYFPNKNRVAQENNRSGTHQLPSDRAATQVLHIHGHVIEPLPHL